jgi:hypothetical protein
MGADVVLVCPGTTGPAPLAGRKLRALSARRPTTGIPSPGRLKPRTGWLEANPGRSAATRSVTGAPPSPGMGAALHSPLKAGPTCNGAHGRR